MEPISVAEKYSDAILAIAEEQHSLEQMETELLYVEQVFSNHKELMFFLESPMIDRKEKISLLQKIFEQDIQKMALQFLYVMVARGREAIMETAIKLFVTKSRIKRGILEAKVIVGSEILPKTEEKLKNKLEELTGKKVLLTVKKNTSAVAGMIIQIGDKRIDASVARALEEMKKSLLKEDAYTAEIGVNDSV